jgi:predicted nucleic acid-binding protein
LRNQAELLAAQDKYPLGLGEISTILLAKDIQADEILLDDYNARKLARVRAFTCAAVWAYSKTFIFGTI